MTLEDRIDSLETALCHCVGAAERTSDAMRKIWMEHERKLIIEIKRLEQVKANRDDDGIVVRVDF